MKISIITTTYKHQNFIAKTIESVLNQTYINWELLIWDDSSDNKTWDIIEKHTQKYPDKIKAWHHSPNKWIIDNMNFLISNISTDSEFIVFLEWDDMITPDYLQKKIDIFDKYPDVALVYNNLDFINEDWNIYAKNYLKWNFYLKNSFLTKKQFLKFDNLYWSYSSLMIKKDILLQEEIQNPTNNKLFSVSDRDLFFRISTKYKCYWLSESLTLYRRHSENLSTSGDSRIIDDLIILSDYYKKTNFLNKKEYNYLIWRLSYTLWCLAIENNNKLLAINKLWQSIIWAFSYNIKGKILLFSRIIIPHKLEQYLLQKLHKKKWK